LMQASTSDEIKQTSKALTGMLIQRGRVRSKKKTVVLCHKQKLTIVETRQQLLIQPQSTPGL
jgi:hypothetical protein